VAPVSPDLAVYGKPMTAEEEAVYYLRELRLLLEKQLAVNLKSTQLLDDIKIRLERIESKVSK